MKRALLVLAILAAALWLGARAFVHRGEVQVTVVLHDAGDLRAGDPVVESGTPVGSVLHVDALNDDDAITLRLSAPHRRAIVSDSLFAIEGHRLMVTNTFAVGQPVADGAVLQPRDDRTTRWLAAHGGALQPLVGRIKGSADQTIDSLDGEVARAKAELPAWKRDVPGAVEEQVAVMRSRLRGVGRDLQRSPRVAQANTLRSRIERWIHEVGSK